MRRNAIARIILFSITIVLLLGILLAGLSIGVYSFRFDSSDYNTTAQTPAVALDASTISRIKIQWAAGNIRVIAADTEEILFSESGAVADDQKMVWNQSGDALTIRYQKPSIQIGMFSEPSKDLTITVPRDWHCLDLSVETASGSVTVEDLIAQQVDVDGASAKCTFQNCYVDTMEISTVSGDIEYLDGSLLHFYCDGVSADCSLQLNKKAQHLELDCVSGSLYLYVPEEFGFTASMDTTSGDFHSDYTVSQSGDTYVYGDGGCRILVSSVSGDISIRKPQA